MITHIDRDILSHIRLSPPLAMATEAFTAEEIKLAEVRVRACGWRLKMGGSGRERGERKRAAATTPLSLSGAARHQRTATPLACAPPDPLCQLSLSAAKPTLSITTKTQQQQQPQPESESTLEAWYMDDSPDDQRLPHRQSPNKPCALAALRRLGVLSWRMDADAWQSDPKLAAVRKVRGYSYSEVIEISKDKLPGYDEKIKMFYEEHIHDDEEVRALLCAAVVLLCAVCCCACLSVCMSARNAARVRFCAPAPHAAPPLRP